MKNTMIIFGGILLIGATFGYSEKEYYLALFLNGMAVGIFGKLMIDDIKEMRK